MGSVGGLGAAVVRRPGWLGTLKPVLFVGAECVFGPTGGASSAGPEILLGAIALVVVRPSSLSSVGADLSSFMPASDGSLSLTLSRICSGEADFMGASSASWFTCNSRPINSAF